jgi:hypothetical protein
MKSIISEIIKDIPDEYTFDAHTVISKLIEEYPDVYNSKKNKFPTEALYHSYISKIIKKVVSTTYKTKNFSINNNGNYSPDNSYKK